MITRTRHVRLPGDAAPIASSNDRPVASSHRPRCRTHRCRNLTRRCRWRVHLDTYIRRRTRPHTHILNRCPTAPRRAAFLYASAYAPADAATDACARTFPMPQASACRCRASNTCRAPIRRSTRRSPITSQPVYALLIGGVSMILAGVLSLRVKIMTK